VIGVRYGLSCATVSAVGGIKRLMKMILFVKQTNQAGAETVRRLCACSEE
jgi:hypothetical protein